nr:protein O-linked-mannose beta-1,4-N-acetylglucosaminyltransferase 2-like [Tanacetum cinerariifolium]
MRCSELRTPQVEQEMGRKDGKENIKTLSAPSRLHFTKSRRWRKVSLTKPPFVNHMDSESLGKPAHMPPRNDSLKDPHEMGHSVDCNLSEALSDYSSIKGMIRIHGLSSTIFTSHIDANTSWIIKPYPRKGSIAMKSVREWTIKPVTTSVLK